MLEKLIIVIKNLLICYLINEVSYINFLLITKLIVIGVEFKIYRKTSFASDNIAKLEKKIRFG